MQHYVESWDDEAELSFQLPSHDRNPIRISSTSSHSSTKLPGEDDLGAESDEDDWARSDDEAEAGGKGGTLKLPPRTDWNKGGGTGDGFDDMEEEDEEENDNADTLKAGSTIKLPSFATIKASISGSGSSNTPIAASLRTPSKNAPSIASFTLPFDDDDDSDFVLPNALSNLSLRPLRPQSSKASFSSVTSSSHSTPTSSNTTNWNDAPSSSTSIGSSSASSSSAGRYLSQHQHSIPPSPSSLPGLVRSSSEPEPSGDDQDFADADADDSLDGILLPDPLFFTRPNSNVRLESLLDAKRKGGVGSIHSGRVGSSTAGGASYASNKVDNVRIVGQSGGGRGGGTTTDDDMSFEAGLVIDQQLNERQLRQVRNKSRSRTMPLPKRNHHERRSGSGSGATGGTVPNERTGSKEGWNKEMERGWGRPKSPLPPSSYTSSSANHSSSSSLQSTRPKPPQPRAATASSILASSMISSTGSASPPLQHTLRSQKSYGRLALNASSTNSPTHPSPPAAPHYPGSHAHTLLTRKASLPVLMQDDLTTSTSSDHRPGTPSSSTQAASLANSRFAAPTAASLARQRDVHAVGTSPTDPNRRAATPTTLLPVASGSAGPTTHPFGTRLTMPTSSSRQKTRPLISSGLFSTGSGGGQESTSGSNVNAAAARRSKSGAVVSDNVLKRPKKRRDYGDGTELDGLEDLRVDREKEAKFRVAETRAGRQQQQDRDTEPLPSSSSSAPLAPPTQANTRAFLSRKPTTSSTLADPKRKKTTSLISNASTTIADKSSSSVTPTSSTKPKGRRPTLIKALGNETKAKVVGKMTYNPKTLRWEGNDAVLSAFEPALSSSRPALITHLTSNSLSGISFSSFGSPMRSAHNNAAPAGGLNPLGVSMKIVGNMQFDPTKMAWVSLLSKEEDEPDCFEGMDDDDDGDMGDSYKAGGCEPKGGHEEDDVFGPGGGGSGVEGGSSSRPSSISRASHPRASHGHPRRPYSVHSRTRSTDSSSSLGASLPHSSSSPHHYNLSGGGGGEELDDPVVLAEFARKCRLAEEGHRAEIGGWALGAKVGREREEARMYEIRKISMRLGA